MGTVIEEMGGLGEWRALSLDATYRIMMSAIGQARHGGAGCGNRDYATRRAIRGDRFRPMDGYLPSGWYRLLYHRHKERSPREVTGVRKLYHLRPTIEHHGRSRGLNRPISDSLPNLRGVGEDPMRLVYRCGACTGAQEQKQRET